MRGGDEERGLAKKGVQSWVLAANEREFTRMETVGEKTITKDLRGWTLEEA